LDSYAELDPEAPKFELHTLSRSPSQRNPWKSIRRTTVRPPKVVQGDLDTLLDRTARLQRWYCLPFVRDSAVDMLVANAATLGAGAFVVVTAGQDFATLCLLTPQRQLLNVPVENVGGMLRLRLSGPAPAAGQASYPCLSALVSAYSAKKQKGLPCPLNPHALDTQEILRLYESATAAPSPPPLASPVYDLGGGKGRSHYQLAVGGLPAPEPYDNTHEGAQQLGLVEYDAAAASTARREYASVGSVGSPHKYSYISIPGALVEEQMELGPQGAPGDEGYIRISTKEFDEVGPICGVSFVPCQDDQVPLAAPNRWL
jgi:hypothetical protein